MSERNEKGQFEKGVTGNPKGRPAKARELAYLAVLTAEVSLDDFRKIVRKAIEDATQGEDGRTRDHGRRFIADYAIGRPKQTIHLSPRDTFNEYAETSDDELRAIAGSDDEEDTDSR